jgi:hypothetical protein
MAELCSSSHDRSEADQSHQRADQPGRKFRHDRGACDCNLVHAVYGGAVSQLLSGQWFHLKNDDDAILYHVPVQRIVYGPSRTIPTFRLVLPTVLSGPSTLNDISACFPR